MADNFLRFILLAWGINSCILMFPKNIRTESQKQKKKKKKKSKAQSQIRSEVNIKFMRKIRDNSYPVPKSFILKTL